MSAKPQPTKHADGLATAARHQKAVRYIGASGYRRFSAGKGGADRSVAAGTWLAVVAAVVGVLILLGVWQESRSVRTAKPAAAGTASAR